MKKVKSLAESVIEISDVYLEDIYNTTQGLRSRFLFFRDEEPAKVTALLKQGWIEPLKTNNKNQMYVITTKLIAKFHAPEQSLSDI